MESVKKQAFEVFGMLSEQEQLLIFEIMKRLVPDDIATLDDIAAHAEAMKEYQQGETINHEDINWE